MALLQRFRQFTKPACALKGDAASWSAKIARTCYASTVSVISTCSLVIQIVELVPVTPWDSTLETKCRETVNSTYKLWFLLPAPSNERANLTVKSKVQPHRQSPYTLATIHL